MVLILAFGITGTTLLMDLDKWVTGQDKIIYNQMFPSIYSSLIFSSSSPAGKKGLNHQ